MITKTNKHVAHRFMSMAAISFAAILLILPGCAPQSSQSLHQTLAYDQSMALDAVIGNSTCLISGHMQFNGWAYEDEFGMYHLEYESVDGQTHLSKVAEIHIYANGLVFEQRRLDKRLKRMGLTAEELDRFEWNEDESVYFGYLENRVVSVALSPSNLDAVYQEERPFVLRDADCNAVFEIVDVYPETAVPPTVYIRVVYSD